MAGFEVDALLPDLVSVALAGCDTLAVWSDQFNVTEPRSCHLPDYRVPPCASAAVKGKVCHRMPAVN